MLHNCQAGTFSAATAATIIVPFDDGCLTRHGIALDALYLHVKA